MRNARRGDQRSTAKAIQHERRRDPRPSAPLRDTHDERQEHPPSSAGYCFVCHGERVH
jgi:hypothetical protein